MTEVLFQLPHQNIGKGIGIRRHRILDLDLFDLVERLGEGIHLEQRIGHLQADGDPFFPLAAFQAFTQFPEGFKGVFI